MEVNLPEDISLEILSRLPKKSLFKCEVVSKEWQKLIKKVGSFCAKLIDYGFIYLEYRIEAFTRKCMFYRLDNKGALTLQDSLLFPTNDKALNVGSCDGFIFYCKQARMDVKFSYHLYNPVTKHLTHLPPLPPFRMAHHPFPTAMGLALCPRNNHYKLIVTYLHVSKGVNKTRSGGLKVAIFDSETREWKTKPAKFSDDSFQDLWILSRYGFLLSASSMYCNGNLYWLQPSYLVMFCVKTGTFRILNLPWTRSGYRGLIWESEGRINYCQISVIHGLCIWVLEEGIGITGTREHMWQKIHSVSKATLNLKLAEIIKPTYPCPFITRVCAFNEHLQILCLQTSEGLVYYDISRKTMTVVPHPNSHNNVIGVLPFTYKNFNLPDIEADKPESATKRAPRKRPAEEVFDVPMRMTRSKSNRRRS